MSKVNFKKIHIGSLIKKRLEELDIDEERVLKFHKANSKEIDVMFQSESLQASAILRWSKLLDYDFFRIYSQHLILYSPPAKLDNKMKTKSSKLPSFRKNIYTREIIDFIVELIVTGEKTKNQIIYDYNIPKTTLYKWIDKYHVEKETEIINNNNF